MASPDASGFAHFEWVEGHTPSDTWLPASMKWLDDIQRAMQMIMDNMVPQIVKWMQENAPWDDITGNAREQLGAQVESRADGIVLVVFQGADYGIFLELNNQGRTAILGRTVDVWGVRFWAEVMKVMS